MLANVGVKGPRANLFMLVELLDLTLASRQLWPLSRERQIQSSAGDKSQGQTAAIRATTKENR